ncbi:uncharacterized protein LOC116267004 [Nymphaea colorata]|uniref:uncharacterized protein LOC116267004 n=1 Tax=Nymphaea colorata TaxID=210225 RepID=UPI00129D298E|nr:uncharacterized protein LOC116267004 [Nymphaea colorata]
MDEKTPAANPEEQVPCEVSVPTTHDPVITDSVHPSSELSLPAESYRLSKQEEREWVERIGNLQRAQSVKGGCQRLAIKTNQSILGLPKLQSCGYTGSCGLRPPSYRKARLFPGQARKGNGRVVLPEMEPVSPKVSCIGSLDLRGKETHRRRKAPTPRSPAVRGGWFRRKLAAMLCRREQAVDCEEPSRAAVEVRRKAEYPAAVAPEEMVVEEKTQTVAPPGIGAMKKFTSCRKSASDVGFLDFDDLEVGSGMKYEMDLHVSSAPPTGRSRAAAVNPYS